VIAAAVFDAGGGGSGSAARPTTATGSTGASVRTLAPYATRLEALPAVRPGSLQGTLEVSDGRCHFTRVDLATMTTRALPAENRQCLQPDQAVRSDVASNVIHIRAIGGHPARTVHIPPGWWWSGETSDGLILCRSGGARLVLFAGGAQDLPSCPVAQIDGQLAFGTRHGRTVTDRAGRVLVALRHPLRDAAVWQLSSGIVVVSYQGGSADLYRNGALLRSLDLGRVNPECGVSDVSLDGRVVLAECGPDGQLAIFRDGVGHPIRDELSSFDALLSPDGRELLITLTYSPRAVILDTTTLAPKLRLTLPGDTQPTGWSS
jgi:hypothetical protein